MGLDIVELLMAVEDEFGISIPDCEAQEVQTVGDLHQLVLRKAWYVLEESQRPVCLSSRVFYLLRRGLMEVTGLPRRAITPQLELAEVLPQARRPQLWQDLRQRSSVNLPRLAFPPELRLLDWLDRHRAWALLPLLCAEGYALYRQGLEGLGMFAVLFISLLPIGLVLAGVGAGLRWRYALAFPAGSSTLGDLATQLVATYAESQKGAEAAALTPEATWERLADLVANEAKVVRSMVRPDARFYEDLRMG